MSDPGRATTDREAKSHPFDPRCVCMECGKQIAKARAWESQLYFRDRKATRS